MNNNLAHNVLEPFSTKPAVQPAWYGAPNILGGVYVKQPYTYYSRGQLKWMQSELFSSTGLRITRKELRGVINDLYESDFAGKGMPPSDATMLDAVRAELLLRMSHIQSEYDPTRMRMYYQEIVKENMRVEEAETCPENDPYYEYRTKRAYDEIYNPNVKRLEGMTQNQRVNRSIGIQYIEDVNGSIRASSLGQSVDQEKTQNKGLEIPFRFIHDWDFDNRNEAMPDRYSLPSFAGTY
jgi:hypothetical protein